MGIQQIAGLSPVLAALVATCFTWAMTAVGAAGVFFFKTVNNRVLNAMLGFAAGVMIAASFWSLLAPAIEMAEGGPLPAWLPAVVGFLVGGVFLWVVDRLLPHLHLGQPAEAAEGIKTHGSGASCWCWRSRCTISRKGWRWAWPSAQWLRVCLRPHWPAPIALAIGIGLQNLPEGVAVSMPLRREGLTPLKGFMYGQASGMVEPIAGVLGAAAVLLIGRSCPTPWLLQPAP